MEAFPLAWSFHDLLPIVGAPMMFYPWLFVSAAKPVLSWTAPGSRGTFPILSRDPSF